MIGLKRAALLTGSAQVGIQTLGVFTGILVARLLGPVGRGQLAAIISWPATLTYLGNLGLPVALTVSAARDPVRRHQLLANGLVMAVGQWMLLGLLGFEILPGVLARHGPELSHLAVLYLWAYLPLNLLTLYVNAIQQGSGAYGRYNMVRLSVPISYALLLLTFWLIQRMTVESVALASILSNAVAFFVAVTLTLPPLMALSRTVSGPWVNLASLWRDVRYGLSAQIGTLQPFSGLRLDVLALTVLAPAHDLGLYMAALAGANVIRAQGYALGQVVLPEVAKRRDSTEGWRIVRRFLLMVAFGSLVAFLVVMVAATPLLRIVYGGAFVAAAPMLRILVAAGGVGATYRILADGLRGMGKPGVSTIAELAGIAGGAGALALLVPTLGAAGAAWSVLTSSIVSLVAASWFANRFRRNARFRRS